MKTETPILKRLGPVPFWRGSEKVAPTLEAMYRRAAERARRALSAQSGKKDGEKKHAPFLV